MRDSTERVGVNFGVDVRAGIVLIALMVGCAIPVEVGVEVGIDFEDDCAFLLPDCSGEGAYSCVTADGVPDPNCGVACVYARTLMCEVDGPACIQSFGDDVPVPVICRAVGE